MSRDRANQAYPWMYIKFSMLCKYIIKIYINLNQGRKNYKYLLNYL